MCILFFQLNAKPEAGGYRLILANNRDEFWSRPTATAAFWGKDGQCLSNSCPWSVSGVTNTMNLWRLISLDKEPSREGGTWIGMTKQGKIGILLNILGENLPNRKGRGFLVSNFLTSDLHADSYLEDMAVDVSKSAYNGFHLALLELGGDKPTSLLLSEKDRDLNKDKGVQTLPLSEVHALGNSACSNPWQKVVHGRVEFQKLVEENNSVDAKTKLVDDLMNLLNDKTQHIPDPVLESTCEELKYPHQIAWERSACRVWSPSISYGTRTNTVILVDWNGNCDYIERSLTTPVQADDPHTVTETFSFKLEPQTPLSAS